MTMALDLQMVIMPDANKLRPEAPNWVTVTLQSNDGLVDGRLSIQLLADNNVLLDHLTETLVVTAEPRRIRLQLPSYLTPDYVTQAEWLLRFQSAGGESQSEVGFIILPDFGKSVRPVGVLVTKGVPMPSWVIDLQDWLSPKVG